MPDPLDPYRQAVRDHGSSFGSTLWASERTQVRRFEVLAEMQAMAGRRLVDAGCGRADMAAWLDASGIRYRHYTGIEALGPLVDHARRRVGRRASILQGDLLADPDLLAEGEPDVILFSGTLNTMDAAAVTRLLEAAWSAAKEAVLFNFLSDLTGPGAPAELGPARRFDTHATLRWAASKTPVLAFRQDYFPAGHDATLRMARP